MWKRALKLSWYDFLIVTAVLLFVAHQFPHQPNGGITAERTFGWLSLIVAAAMLLHKLFAKKPEAAGTAERTDAQHDGEITCKGYGPPRPIEDEEEGEEGPSSPKEIR